MKVIYKNTTLLVVAYLKISVSIPDNPNPQDLILPSCGEQSSTLRELHAPDRPNMLQQILKNSFMIDSKISDSLAIRVIET